MCGIAGIVGGPSGPERTDRVSAMVDHLRRRGPDGHGVRTWPNATLGHRRLAIFDLSEAGHQPMTTPDGAVGVVFNGAIYNWPELRGTLEAAGCQFVSNSDTEVLLHGYREWGISGLVGRLRGMFAFALWDDLDHRLFLVRDRLGVKPLSFIEQEGSIAFASTPAALHAAGFAPDLSDQAVVEFLEFGFVPERSSIFQGVRKVPPATISEWSSGRLTTRTYWSMPGARQAGSSAALPRTSAQASRSSFEQAVDEAEARLVDAVSIRQFADVPVAALLSGGVDSALVCSALAEVGANVTAYTVGTPGAAGDETANAVATARHLGLDHEVIPLTDSEAADLTEITQAYAEPFACASALGMLAVSKAIKPHATVVLTGDGGDDAFLGYRRQRYLWLAERAARKIPGPALSAWRTRAGSGIRGGLGKKALRFMDAVAGGLGAYMSQAPGPPQFAEDGWLGERSLGRTIQERVLPQTNQAARSSLADFLEFHRQEKLVAEYLTKVDGATMYHGLEARSPFMDHVLWEFAGGTPPADHLHRGKLKAILRAVARRRLGDRVADERKQGFEIPVERWLAGRWRDSLEPALRDSVLEREGFVRTGPLLRQLNAVPPGGRVPTHLWYYYVLETWMRARN